MKSAGSLLSQKNVPSPRKVLTRELQSLNVVICCCLLQLKKTNNNEEVHELALDSFPLVLLLATYLLLLQSSRSPWWQTDGKNIPRWRSQCSTNGWRMRKVRNSFSCELSVTHQIKPLSLNKYLDMM